METPTIISIRNVKNEILEHLKTYKTNLKSKRIPLDSRYGNENEFTINDIIVELKTILSELSILTKSTKLFVNLSTFGERSAINNHLQTIYSHLVSFQFPQILNSLDSLKVLVRSYGLKKDKEKYVSYLQALDELNEKSSSIQDNLDNIQKNEETSSETLKIIEGNKEKFENELHELNILKSQLNTEISELKTKNTELQNYISSITNSSKKIDQLLNSASANEKTIKTFAEIVSKRESQVNEQEIKTQEYISKLNDFREEREKILDDAKHLIKSAREALNLKTAEGISASFSIQYEKADNPKNKRNWLIGAAIFFIVTILLGIWILTGWWIDDPLNINSIIGRVALLPFTLLGTLFCANQYLRQKNLAEDYAYKTVLAKSMIAFSEELKQNNPDKYGEYISSVLNEILQDPLRKRGKDEKVLTENISAYRKIFELFKEFGSNQNLA